MAIEIKKIVDEHIGNFLVNIIATTKNKGVVNKNPRNILLIKFWGIGNIVMLTPSMRAIREKFPNSKIYFLTFSRNRGLLENLDYVDDVIYYKLGGLDITKIIALISRYYKKFDIVIDFEQFVNISSIIAYFLGRYRIGFSNKTRARHKLYDSFKPCSNKSHMIKQFYGLCEKVGVKKKDFKLESFDFVDKSVKVDNFLKEKGIAFSKKEKKPILIGVHIGSSENAEVKRWPKGYFIELINLLNKRLHNLIFVMTGTESENSDVAVLIKKISKKNCYNSCGIFNLKDLIYFIKKCNLFISNDTGPIHIASIRGITCVSFYGPTSPTLYGPYGKNHIVFYEKIKCGPCVNNYSSKSSSCKNPICMKKIKPKKVVDVMVNYIKKNKNLG